MVTEDIREVVRRADGITEFLAVCNRIHVVPEIRENNLTYLYTEKTVSIFWGGLDYRKKQKRNTTKNRFTWRFAHLFVHLYTESDIYGTTAH